MQVYSWDLGEKTHYFLDQAEAEQAFAGAEQAGGFPEWREPCDVVELLETKDELLAKFAKHSSFLELQLERAELGKSDDYQLG